MPASPIARCAATAGSTSCSGPFSQNFARSAASLPARRRVWRNWVSPPPRVRVTGNLKFDAAEPGAHSGLDVPGLLHQIGVNDKARLLVAGSTHAGEESLLAEMLPRLRQRFPDLFLVLVPRHFERAGSWARNWRRAASSSSAAPTSRRKRACRPARCNVCWSTAPANSSPSMNRPPLVFVGKSLSARGGQNPIEPAALAKPMVFGPNMQNFASVVGSLLAARGAIQVRTPAELEQALAQLLADDALRAALGGRARQVVQDNLGATRRTVEMILQAGAGEMINAKV